jgi:hypothetical protein
LQLDAKVGGALFKGDKQQQALQEGTKLKALVQRARSLWRNCRSGGRTEEMRMLKSLFSPSAKKGENTDLPDSVWDIPESPPDGLAAELTQEPRTQPCSPASSTGDEYARLLRHWVEAGLPASDFPEYFEQLHEGATHSAAASSSSGLQPPAAAPNAAGAERVNRQNAAGHVAIIKFDMAAGVFPSNVHAYPFQLACMLPPPRAGALVVAVSDSEDAGGVATECEEEAEEPEEEEAGAGLWEMGDWEGQLLPPREPKGGLPAVAAAVEALLLHHPPGRVNRARMQKKAGEPGLKRKKKKKTKKQGKGKASFWRGAKKPPPGTRPAAAAAATAAPVRAPAEAAGGAAPAEGAARAEGAAPAAHSSQPGPGVPAERPGSSAPKQSAPEDTGRTAGARPPTKRKAAASDLLRKYALPRGAPASPNPGDSWKLLNMEDMPDAGKRMRAASSFLLPARGSTPRSA